MTTELRPVLLTTPSPETIVTPVVKRPVLGRALDALLLALGIIVELADFIGAFDLSTLGLNAQEVARVWFVIIVARFAMSRMKPKLIALRAEPVLPDLVEPTKGAQ